MPYVCVCKATRISFKGQRSIVIKKVDSLPAVFSWHKIEFSMAYCHLPTYTVLSVLTCPKGILML